jgi:hypothetical protein
MIKTSSTAARRSGSAQTVRHRFADLERHVRTTLCLAGISRIVVLLFGGMIVCGFVDWLIHLDDAGLRLIVGLLSQSIERLRCSQPCWNADGRISAINSAARRSFWNVVWTLGSVRLFCSRP